MYHYTIYYSDSKGFVHKLSEGYSNADWAINRDEVNFKDVNNLAIMVDTPTGCENPRIFQASGYSLDSGLFVRMY